MRRASQGNHMSTRTFLVSLPKKQCVEVAASSGGGVRITQERKALALFVHAYRGEGYLDASRWTDRRLET